MLVSFVTFCCLFIIQCVPNLPQSALSFVTCVIILFVYVAHIMKEKMHCNVFQLWFAKRQKYRYQHNYRQ